MGFEIIVGIALGFIILGPRRMHSMLGTLGQAKAHFDRAKRDLTAQIEAEVNKPQREINAPPTPAVSSLPAETSNR